MSFLVINQKKFDSLGKPDRDAIMAVSGEEFGTYAAGWDANEKNAVRQAREAGIQTIKLPPATLAELKKRWSVIEPQWIADASKLGIDGKAAVAFYRGALAKLHEGR